MRTLQELLAERRACLLEAMRAIDRVTQENLLAHVAVLDAELSHRTGCRIASPVTMADLRP